jgi:divalent metal cation (Fe/Co/Zn/Cd) transporter
MKTAWVEDMLSMIPPAAWLVASRFRDRAPNDRFPYGRHRSISIAFLCGTVALLGVGGFLLADGLAVLARGERPAIGGVALFGRTVWMGWAMVAVLVYTVVPAVLLGRAKLRLSRRLHDKVLHADADMNKADWMTGGGAVAGVLLVGLGLWWADAVVAVLIASSVVRDGVVNLRNVVSDLMDAAPTTVDRERDPLPARVATAVGRLPWADDVRVRFRDEGHVLTGEVWIRPADERDLLSRADEARELVRGLDWRLHDVAIVLVRDLDASGGDGEEPSLREGGRGRPRATRA